MIHITYLSSKMSVQVKGNGGVDVTKHKTHKKLWVTKVMGPLLKEMH